MNALEAASWLVENTPPLLALRAAGEPKDAPLIRDAIYPASIARRGSEILAMVRLEAGRRLLAVSKRGNPAVEFAGETGRGQAFAFKVCPLSRDNARALRAAFAWTAPVSLADRKTTFGCGDRLGRATSGHLRAVRKYQVSPVLAQQSMRELTLTGRTFQDVLDDVTFQVFQSGFAEGYGADADHLKTLEHIAAALGCGMTMITLDLSEVMRPSVAAMASTDLEAEFRKLPPDVQSRALSEYAGKDFPLSARAGTATVSFDRRTAALCAVMYAPALVFAGKVHDLLLSKRGAGNFDLELSIDETTTPTLPSHHLFIVRELRHRGIGVVSLAPRFIGEFQKGIDYMGDLEEFSRQFRVHAIIAQTHGDYKISVHSGSDKFSIFPAVGEITGGRFHEKTAGTSWLEAVRLVALNAPDLYRRFHEIALERLPDAQKLYHITPDLGRIPALRGLRDGDLPGLMEQDAPRQVLHVAYGFILQDPALKKEFFTVLDRFEEEYGRLLDAHFSRHMERLGIPRRQA